MLEHFLEQERSSNRALINSILETNRPHIVEESKKSNEDFQPIHRGPRRLSVLRSTLEAADKAKAEELRAKIKIEMNQVKPKTEEELLGAIDEVRTGEAQVG